MGLLPDVEDGGLPSDRYRPDSFAENHSPQLASDYHLGSEVEIERDA
jgi:hypothetical protein